MGAPIRGNAALTWTDAADTMSQRVLLLREPLRELKYGHRQNIYPADSLDYTQRQVYTIGTGAYELTGKVRFADNGQTLIDLIKAGSKLTTLIYYPNLADPGVQYACQLISPLSPTVLKMDQNTGTEFGDQDVELVLRKTDQTPFAAVQQNILLFAYRAGDRIQEGTYSRVGTARYAKNSSAGYGTLSTATTNLARLHWMSTASSQGPRTVPTLLLEGARTNVVHQSQTFAATTWAKVGSITVTTGKADPAGGLNAARLRSTVAGARVEQIITLTAATRAVQSLFVAPGTAPTTSIIALRSTNSATTYLNWKVSWSSGLPTLTVTKGQSIGPMERWMNGFYRLAVRSSGTLTTGKYLYKIFPSTAAATKTVHVYGAQVEN